MSPRRRFLRAVGVALAVLITLGSLFGAVRPDLAGQFLAATVTACPNVVRVTALSLFRSGGECGLGQALAAVRFQEQLDTHHRVLQASSRLLRTDGEFQLWSTPRGTWWIHGNTRFGFTFMLAEQAMGIYDRRGCARGDIVLDCGANYGMYTRHALNAGAALVVAIEPEEGNLECLRRNFPVEISAGRVVLVDKGVWKERGTLKFFLNRDSPTDSFVLHDRDAKEVQIPVDTVDNIVHELKLPRVDFIKMDIEGSERHALAGAAETLRRFHPRMAICAYHLPDDSPVIRSVVHAASASYRNECACEDETSLVVPMVLTFF